MVLKEKRFISTMEYFMQRDHYFREIYSGHFITPAPKTFSFDVLSTTDYHIICLFGGAIPLHIYEDAILQMTVEEVIKLTPRELRGRLDTAARSKNYPPYVVIKQLQALTDEQWEALWTAVDDIPYPVVLPVGHWTPQKEEQLFHERRVEQTLGIRMLPYTSDEVGVLLQGYMSREEQREFMKVSNGDRELVDATLDLAVRGHLTGRGSLKQTLFEYMRNTRSWWSVREGLSIIVAEERVSSLNRIDVAAQFLRAVVCGERYSPEFGRNEAPPIQLSTLGMVDYDARGMWGVTSPVHASLGREALTRARSSRRRK